VLSFDACSFLPLFHPAILSPETLHVSRAIQVAFAVYSLVSFFDWEEYADNLTMQLMFLNNDKLSEKM
jgi:hypothetical protein